MKLLSSAATLYVALILGCSSSDNALPATATPDAGESSARASPTTSNRNQANLQSSSQSPAEQFTLTPEVAKLVASYGVYASIRESDGQRIVYYSAIPDTLAVNNGVLGQTPLGTGIPLQRLDYSWEVKNLDDPKLLVSEDQLETCIRKRLRLIDAPIITSMSNIVWTTDGRFFFGLTDANRRLVKIDSKTMEVAASVRPDVPIKSICMSKSGLIAIQHALGQRNKVNGDGGVWVYYSSAEHDRFYEKERLLLIDPVSLEVKTSWHLQAESVSGSPGSNLIYATDWVAAQGLIVVDMSNASIVHMVSSLDVPSQQTQEIDRAVLHFDSAFIDSESNRMFTVSRGHAKLHRFSLQGPEVTHQESVSARDDTVTISPDGRFVATRNHVSMVGEQFSIYEAGGFEESLATVPAGVSRGMAAISPKSRTIFVQHFNEEHSRYDLHLVQNGMVIEAIPLDDRIESMSVHSQSAGAVVVFHEAMWWIEPDETGPPWIFE